MRSTHSTAKYLPKFELFQFTYAWRSTTHTRFDEPKKKMFNVDTQTQTRTAAHANTLTQIISDWIPWECSATLDAYESFPDRQYTKTDHDFQSALPIVRPNLQLSHLLMNRQQLRLYQYRLFSNATINVNYVAWRTTQCDAIQFQPGSKLWSENSCRNGERMPDKLN